MQRRNCFLCNGCTTPFSVFARELIWLYKTLRFYCWATAIVKCASNRRSLTKLLPHVSRLRVSGIDNWAMRLHHYSLSITRQFVTRTTTGVTCTRTDTFKLTRSTVTAPRRPASCVNNQYWENDAVYGILCYTQHTPEIILLKQFRSESFMVLSIISQIGQTVSMVMLNKPLIIIQ
jgi:hypothetical protein